MKCNCPWWAAMPKKNAFPNTLLHICPSKRCKCIWLTFSVWCDWPIREVHMWSLTDSTSGKRDAMLAISASMQSCRCASSLEDCITHTLTVHFSTAHRSYMPKVARCNFLLCICKPTPWCLLLPCGTSNHSGGSGTYPNYTSIPVFVTFFFCRLLWYWHDLNVQEFKFPPVYSAWLILKTDFKGSSTHSLFVSLNIRIFARLAAVSGTSATPFRPI